MRACPYCAERIQNAAILCRYCGKTVLPVARSSPSASMQLSSAVAIALLLVLMGVALLYAYRAQSPTAAAVSYAQAVTEIQNGQVRTVAIDGDVALVELTDGSQQQVTIAANTAAVQQVVLDHNATQPAERRVLLSERREGMGPVGLVGTALLGALPLVFVGLLLVLLFRAVRRR